MEEYVVYILYSKKYCKTYVGATSQLIQRFKSHNELGRKGWTIKFRPWTVVFVKFFSAKKEAFEFEKYLKTGKGRRWIKTHVNFKT